MARTKQPAMKNANPSTEISPPSQAFTPSPSRSPSPPSPPTKRARSQPQRFANEGTSSRRPKTIPQGRFSEKAKGKAKAKSHTYGENDFLTFLSDEEYDRFITKFATMDIHVPRYLNYNFLQEKGFTTLLSALRNGKWYELLGKKVEFISEPLIRAFYSNMEYEAGDEDTMESLVTNINGHQIVVDVDLIHKLTKLSKDGPKDPEDVEYDVHGGMRGFLFQIHASPHPSGRGFAITNMDEDYRVAMYMLTKVINPRLSSLSYINSKDAKLMFIFMRGIEFNWCQVIFDNMKEIVQYKVVKKAIQTKAKKKEKIKHSKVALPYASLIMDIVKAQKVNIKKFPLTTHRVDWEVDHVTFKKGGTSVPRTPKTKKAKFETTVLKALKTLQKEVKKFGRKLDKFFKKHNYVPSEDEDSTEEESEESQDEE